MADVEVTATEGGDEVTFVNGKAVEQTTGGEAPEGDRGDELSAAREAVKKAIAEDAKAEGIKAAKEAKEHKEKDPLIPRDRDADGKFITADPAEKEKADAVKQLKKEAPEDPEASALRKALTERKEQAKYKAEAAATLEKERAEVRQIHAQLQARERQVKADQEKMAMFRKDPARAIRENGWENPEDFIMDVALEGTPEGQARRAQRQRDQEIADLRAWRDNQERQQQEQQAAQEQRQKQAYRQQVERQFVTTALDETAHPHLSAMYKGHEVSLCAEADVIADQYRRVTGQEATFKELAEYLEERSAKWYKDISSKRNAVGQPPTTQAAQQAAVTQGRPAQGSVTGKKSLSPAGSSERRSLGANLADLDGEDRLEAAKTAVKAAIAASGGS